MQRLINRRQQGDLGEASALEWLTRSGAVVFVPVGHSPDVDLIAHWPERTLRIQIKTSVQRTRTPNGHERFCVQLATLGGNQSWSGAVKHFDAAKADALFVLTADGRRWFIPAQELQSISTVKLGGPRYSEFEIAPTEPISAIVYGRDGAALESSSARGSFGVGEPSGPVKSVAQPEWVRIPPPPLSTLSQALPPDQESEWRAPLGPHGQTRVSGSRQIVVPKQAFDLARLRRGDRLKAVATGEGEVLFRRVARQNDEGPPNGSPSQTLLDAPR